MLNVLSYGAFQVTRCRPLRCNACQGRLGITHKRCCEPKKWQVSSQIEKRKENPRTDKGKDGDRFILATVPPLEAVCLSWKHVCSVNLWKIS